MNSFKRWNIGMIPVTVKGVPRWSFVFKDIVEAT